MVPDMLLRDRTAVVTGNPYGIGEAVARLFSEHGARVVCFDDAAGDAWHDDAALPAGVQRHVVDVTDATALAELVSQCEPSLDAVDILVNLPGRAFAGTFEQTTMQTWHEAIERNLTAVFVCSHVILERMKRRAGGVIINHGSIDGALGNPSIAAYSAAKGGIVPLTHVMAHDLARYRIRVNSISTGGIRNGVARPTDATLAALTPAGRTGTPLDVAHVALFLASDWSSYVNGANIVVDGGRTTITPGCYGDPHGA